MNTRTDSVMLSDDALDMVAGGGLISDVGQFATKVVKGAVHYAALGTGHLMDAETHNKPFHKKLPAFFDGLMDKLL